MHLPSVLNDMRKSYARGFLLEEDCNKNPFVQFEDWLKEALSTDEHHANAMCLSTVSGDFIPDSRMVLLRNISFGGLTFYTNYDSEKGKQIALQPNASLLFFWKELERQIRIQGAIKFLPQQESDDYFNSRPFESKVGAWVSQQSQVLKDRATLDQLFSTELSKYDNGTVPRPPHWGGYVLIPSKFEFWQGRPDRLHDRIRYTQLNEGGNWTMERLMP